MGKRAKEIMLFVLAVAALVTAVYSFRGAPSSSPAPTEEAISPEPKLIATAPEAVASSVAPSAAPGKGDSRNPFSAPAGAPAAAVSPPTTEESSEPSAIPAQVARATPPLPAAPDGAAPAVPQQTAPTLSGVIVDSSGRPTAVIREGDKSHFAKTGDKIAGKYRVQSISNREVVLVSTQEKLILQIGGNR